MVSPKRLLANRLNARRSTGPRTPAGKAASSVNALKHGVFAHLPVLAGLGESEADWETHRAGVVQSLAPVGAAELNLAEHAADLLWRINRAARYDTACAAATFAPVVAALPAPTDGVVTADLQSRDKARAAVDGTRAAAALLARLDGADDDEPVDPAAAEAAWKVGVRVIDRHPEQSAGSLLAGFLPAYGVTEVDCYCERAYLGWTVRWVREGYRYLAGRAGRPLAEVLARARATAPEWITYRAAIADRAGRLAATAAAAHAGAAVGRALAAVPDRALAAHQLATLYEQRLGAELERTLRLLDGLRRTREWGDSGPDEEVAVD